MKIGLLGFGVVGRGVYEITENRDDMQVTKVLCLEDIKLPDAQAVHNIRDIVEDDSIDTVVEAMGGLHPAYDFVRAAVEARLETQKTSFDGYGLEQYDLLTNHSILDIRGNYVLFIVHKDAAAVQQAFRGAL